MPLDAGTRVGHYQLHALIGVGGMGEVYRATDTKLHRDVAVKVLPSQFTVDADRMQRFQREAHVLASLNHTLIAAIYGLEDAPPIHALIMELVEGPTLAEKLQGQRAEGRGERCRSMRCCRSPNRLRKNDDRRDARVRVRSASGR